MADETKLHRDKARAVRARAILDDDMVRDAFKTLEATYTTAWAQSGPHEALAREHFWQALQILSDFERHFKNTVISGKLAEKELFDLANKFRPRAA